MSSILPYILKIPTFIGHVWLRWFSSNIDSSCRTSLCRTSLRRTSFSDCGRTLSSVFDREFAVPRAYCSIASRSAISDLVYFQADEVHACIVTCGDLCPRLNIVIRELVCGLCNMYGVKKVLGIKDGYRGFYSKNTIHLTLKFVNDIHKRGGTIIGTSQGGLYNWWRWNLEGSNLYEIVDLKLLILFLLCGSHLEVRRRGLKVSIVGIPKTIDNDILVIDKSFGFDTTVEEAQRAINAAHVEVESMENGIGLVKLMGHYCDNFIVGFVATSTRFIAMYATLASRDVDCCLIPESHFYLEGPGGLYEYIARCLKHNDHMVIIIAKGVGQELLSGSFGSDKQNASGNKLLQDIGLWLSQRIKFVSINL
ncbi:ATP-dependent 6-phosphofructokinase 7-like [Cucumis melo var. makuwa]|uniref:ATP-dependent 6-phosphofructokinase 7-like n=1 Tax=Cucumis melo var. makuwa TaxID=1194695 RepID=A0A5D3CA01_CUCMM|nr:ATP-dependent 6-phosphofructokinase 7-like [Cucumis melo var. makuwa]